MVVQKMTGLYSTYLGPWIRCLCTLCTAPKTETFRTPCTTSVERQKCTKAARHEILVNVNMSTYLPSVFWITINSVVLSVKWELLLNYFHPDPIKIFFKSYFSQGTNRRSNKRRPNAKIFKGRYFDYLIFPIISPRVYQEILNFKKRASLWKPCS